MLLLYLLFLTRECCSTPQLLYRAPLPILPGSVLPVIGGQEGPVCDLSDAQPQAVPVGQGGGQAEGFPPPSYVPNQEVGQLTVSRWMPCAIIRDWDSSDAICDVRGKEENSEEQEERTEFGSKYLCRLGERPRLLKIIYVFICD